MKIEEYVVKRSLDQAVFDFTQLPLAESVPFIAIGMTLLLILFNRPTSAWAWLITSWLVLTGFDQVGAVHQAGFNCVKFLFIILLLQLVIREIDKISAFLLSMALVIQRFFEKRIAVDATSPSPESIKLLNNADFVTVMGFKGDGENKGKLEWLVFKVNVPVHVTTTKKYVESRAIGRVSALEALRLFTHPSTRTNPKLRMHFIDDMFPFKVMDIIDAPEPGQSAHLTESP